MRSLVVGGAGFVGSHVVDRLLAEGHTVDVVDDLSTGSLSNLAMARAEHIGSLKFHNVDVRQPELADLLGRLRPEVAVHLALPSSGPPARVLSTALGGTANLLDAAVIAGTTKVVVGLDAVAYYGAVPLRELPIKEGTLGTPGSSATIAQRAVADLLALYREQHALEYTALALGSVYGTRQRPAGGVVAAFVAARQAGRPAEVYGTGKQTRDFVAVDDAVDALVRATTRGTGLVVNVGTGVQTSVAALAPAGAGRPVGGRRARSGAATATSTGSHCRPSVPASTWRGRRGRTWTPASGSCWPSWRRRPRRTPPASTEPPPPEPSGGELVDGVAGADDAALHDTGVDPAQMELPTDG